MNILKLRPPQIAAIYLLFTLGIQIVFKPRVIFSFDHRSWGMLAILVGFVIMFWAWLLFRKHKTPVRPTQKPTALVTSGPFEWSRNPMYLGIVLILWGIALFVGTLIMFFAPLAFFLTINGVFIPYEEKKMKRLFGERYLHYQHRVRRWL